MQQMQKLPILAIFGGKIVLGVILQTAQNGRIKVCSVPLALQKFLIHPAF